MRILHFSDVHVDVPFRHMPVLSWPGKRVIGGMNLALFRRREFRDAEVKLRALAAFRKREAVDLVVSSGDFTALGTEPEYRRARMALAPMYDAPEGFLAVPGNHDVYMPEVVRHRRFEQFFGDTLLTDRPDLATDGPWPLVKRVGDDVAVVSVNSARPNPQPWRSSGRVPDAQIAGLRAALADPGVRGRFCFVLTHYAPVLADGRPDKKSHGMVNADAFLDACRGADRGAILCGHMHRGYRVAVPGVPTEIFCAGSATAEGKEGVWVFDVDGPDFRARWGRWDGEGYRLDG